MFFMPEAEDAVTALGPGPTANDREAPMLHARAPRGFDKTGGKEVCSGRSMPGGRGLNG
jgi:hypothetical protein